MEKLPPKTGRVLISDPFMDDPNFTRSVVLLVEYSETGTVGFVLNNSIDIPLSIVLNDEFLPGESVFQGGPVELNTMHFIHSLGDSVPGATQIGHGLWWGGDFELAIEMIRNDKSLISQFQFFLGYSGWSPGQLEEEIEGDAWLVSRIRVDQIFKPQENSKSLWKELMEGLGGEFRYLSNSPLDPQLN